MAGVTASRAPAPPPLAETERGITIRHNGDHVQVEVDGVPLRRITDIGVSFIPNGVPEVRVSMAPLACDIRMDHARLAIAGFEVPHAVQRALYDHLRATFQSQSGAAASGELNA